MLCLRRAIRRCISLFRSAAVTVLDCFSLMEPSLMFVVLNKVDFLTKNELKTKGKIVI